MCCTVFIKSVLVTLVLGETTSREWNGAFLRCNKHWWELLVHGHHTVIQKRGRRINLAAFLEHSHFYASIIRLLAHCLQLLQGQTSIAMCLLLSVHSLDVLHNMV